MKKYDHLKKLAIELRAKNFTLPTICERLGLSKGTVFYWIKDIPIPRTEDQRKCTVAASRANKEKWEKIRREYYNLGKNYFSEIERDPHLRDFVIIYLTEGYRKTRNVVQVTNSNINIIQTSHKFIQMFSNKKITYNLQCHVDNDEEKLLDYWSNGLKIDRNHIRIIRKSNSGNLSGRKWRSLYGVMGISVNDTKFRMMIESWMDFIQEDWKKRAVA